MIARRTCASPATSALPTSVRRPACARAELGILECLPASSLGARALRACSARPSSATLGRRSAHSLMRRVALDRNNQVDRFQEFAAQDQQGRGHGARAAQGRHRPSLASRHGLGPLSTLSTLSTVLSGRLPWCVVRCDDLRVTVVRCKIGRASARHRASAQPPAPEPEADATGWVPVSSRAQGETAREHPAEAGSRGLNTEKKALSIEQATAMQPTQKAQARASPHARAGKSVWGVNGTEGIPPEASLAMLRAKMTHSWGPKPAAVHRSCQMREGNVTKRIRMDRDRMARSANVSQQHHADRSNPAAYFKPVPLSVLQTNKGLALGSGKAQTQLPR